MPPTKAVFLMLTQLKFYHEKQMRFPRGSDLVYLKEEK